MTELVPKPVEQLDLRLVLPAVGIWAATALAVGLSDWALAVTCFISGVVLAGAFVFRYRPIARGTFLVALAMSCGVGSTLASQHERHSGLLVELSEQHALATITGTALTDPHPVSSRRAAPWSGQRHMVVLRADHVEGRGKQGDADARVVVMMSGDVDHLAAGQKISATVSLRPSPRSDPAVALAFSRDVPTIVEKPNMTTSVTDQLRQGLRNAMTPRHDDAKALIPGLVVGDTSLSNPTLQRHMHITGLTHLTAVSGSNVAIVTGAAWWLASLLMAPRKARVVVALAALVGFVFLARPEPSVLRAAVMGTVGLITVFTTRRKAAISALCTAIIVLLCYDPWLARAPGFILSVAATAALIALAPVLIPALARVMPLPLAQATAVPLAAQSVCGPIIVVLSGEVSLVAVIANLLVAPVVAPATILGVAITIVYPLSPTAAGWLSVMASWCGQWIGAVAHWGAKVPLATIDVPASFAGAFVVAVVTLVALGFFVARPVQVAKLVALCLIAILVMWVSLRATSTSSTGTRWDVAACDVGQGDAFVLRTATNSAILIDTGPEPDAINACLTDLGITTLDLLVLSHYHLDHVAGLPGVLRNRVVRHVILPTRPWPAANAATVRAQLDRAGSPTEVGQHGVAGTTSDWSWTLHTRAPSSSLSSDEVDGTAVNDTSLAVHFQRAGFSVLTTGDLETLGQRALARSHDASWDVDIMTVPHHGSARRHPSLLEATSPRLALISVGRDNDYGHPAESTLRALQDAGVPVARTDELGTVTVRFDHDTRGLHVSQR